MQLSIGETVAIAVSDNGPGLPKQNRSRLLEPYVTTKGHKGTGLGLAIVQKITEQHGGQLLLDDAAVTAERASGARVTLSFAAFPVDDNRQGRWKTAAARSAQPNEFAERTTT